MRRTEPERSGFSLPELLVAIGIMVVLIAILLPVVNGARRAARSAACLANLQQWGQSFQMYLSSNKGRTLPEPSNNPVAFRWWDRLAPYNSDVKAALLCPEASEPRPGPPDPGQRRYRGGTAVYAYDGGSWRGSYGFNNWLYEYHRPLTHPDYIRFPPRQADRIPWLGDCCGPWTAAFNTDSIPMNLQKPEPGTGMGVSQYCIDRHAMAVNLAYLDGHAEHVPLSELWRQKWSDAFRPRDAVVPSKSPFVIP